MDEFYVHVASHYESDPSKVLEVDEEPIPAALRQEITKLIERFQAEQKRFLRELVDVTQVA